ncbi:MAG: HipA N-terminal domain-containing protein [Kiritimatiellia bacterium]|jgi:hypothetical protein|nr:HipA N-terminal domain-containing protein [Kiritimatiellia bacterium]
MAIQLADVIYQDAKVGAVYWDSLRHVAVFEYTPDFIAAGVELAPLKMPARGKRKAITTQDLLDCGRECGIATLPKLKGIINEVTGALENWNECAAEAGVGDREAGQIKMALATPT